MRKFADVVETVGKRWRQLESFGADFEESSKGTQHNSYAQVMTGKYSRILPVPYHRIYMQRQPWPLIGCIFPGMGLKEILHNDHRSKKLPIISGGEIPVIVKLCGRVEQHRPCNNFSEKLKSFFFLTNKQLLF